MDHQTPRKNPENGELHDDKQGHQPKGSTMEKIDKEMKQVKIPSCKGYDEELIIKEYIAEMETHNPSIKKAKTPPREALLEMNALLDNSVYEYRTTPVTENGQRVLSEIPNVPKHKILECAEKIYANEMGLIDPKIAYFIIQKLKYKAEFETLVPVVATMMGDAIVVYDWIVAQDPQSKRRKLIQTWIPIHTSKTKTDNYGRNWLMAKTWQSYTKQEKEIFKRFETSYKISHFWIFYKTPNSANSERQYKVIPNSFTILLPTIIRYKNPNMNLISSDVAVHSQCSLTEDVNQVIVIEKEALPSIPTKYDKDQMTTPCIPKIIGPKYYMPYQQNENEIILDPSITDPIVRQRLQECYLYSIDTELEQNIKEAIEKVYALIKEKLEVAPEIINILQNVSATRKSFHLLAFLSNANIWLRYGPSKTNKESMRNENNPRWIPLSYKYSLKSNKKGTPRLSDISTEIENEMCMAITGNNSNNICPRYFAIGLKTLYGYRILKNSIIDSYTYNMTKDLDLTKNNKDCDDYNAKRFLQEIYEITPNKIPKQTIIGAYNKSKQMQNSPLNGNSKPLINWEQCDSIPQNENEDSNTIKEKITDKIEKSSEVQQKDVECVEAKETNEDAHKPQTDIMVSVGNQKIRKHTSSQNLLTSQDNNNIHIEQNISKNSTNNGDHNIIIVTRYNIVRAEIQPIINVRYNEIIVTHRDIVEHNYSSKNINKITISSKKDSNVKTKDAKVSNRNDIKMTSKEDQKHDKNSKKKDMLDPIVVIPLQKNEKGKSIERITIYPKSDLSSKENGKEPNSVSQKKTKKESTKQGSNLTQKQNNKNIKMNKTLKNDSNKVTQKDKNKTKGQKEMKKIDFHVPENVINKTITKAQMKTLNTLIKKNFLKTKEMVNYWLSIGENLQSDIPKIKVDKKENMSQAKLIMKAQRTFDKGNIGKAFEMVTTDSKEPIYPSKEDIDKLFPQRKIELSKIKFKSSPFVVTDNQIEFSLKSIKNGKGAGMSGLLAEHVKQLVINVEQREFLRKTIQSIINQPNQAPEQLFTSKLTCIPKNNNGLRPLCVSEMLLKLTNKIINASILTHINAYIDESQTCLSGQNAQLNAVQKLIEIINENVDESKFITQIDMTNAFGSIEHRVILEELQKIKGVKSMAKYISVLLQRMQIQYETKDGEFVTRRIDRGVPQGDPISMSIFAVALNRVIRILKEDNENSIDIIAYADDVLIITDTEQKMEEAVSKFKQEAMKIGLSMNENKTNYFTTNNENCDKYNSLHSNVIEYLGIPISLNSEMTKNAVKEKLEEVYDTAKILWNCNGLSLQGKYHMYQTCVLSKVIYLFRGTDIDGDIMNISNKIEELYKEEFPIDIEILRMPVSIGGMGLLYLEDIRQISRLSYLVEIKKKKIPEILKRHINMKENIHPGEMQHNISKAYYKMKREKYMTETKNIDKHIKCIMDDDQTPTAHSLFISPPSNQTQALDDFAFRIAVALRYHKDIVEHGNLSCQKCNMKDVSLWHMLRCSKEQAKTNIYIHEKLKGIIGVAIKRNKNVFDVNYEEYGKEQNNETKEHRPDILVSLINGEEHLLDICVENKFGQWGSCGTEPTTGYKKKIIQYKNTKAQLYPIAFDNSGRLNNESYKYLKNMGVSKGIIKFAQCLIIKANVYALMKISNQKIEQTETDLRKEGVQLDEEVVIINSQSP